jgi:hypothetical protein
VCADSFRCDHSATLSYSRQYNSNRVGQNQSPSVSLVCVCLPHSTSADFLLGVKPCWYREPSGDDDVAGGNEDGGD